MNEREYYIGLDMGTGSVGWAVTDMDYNLIKINRKNAWGSVLFETSQGAADRRIHRCARRRSQRKKERIRLLQELFAPEIEKIDAGFFLRLKESRYTADDKRDANGRKPELPYTLFADANYTDKDFYRDFPTIYHLRKAFLEDTKRQFDVRLLYLAVAHIIKNRGHFLASMGSGEGKPDFQAAFENMLQQWNVLTEDGSADYLELTENQIADIEKKLKNERLTKTQKKEELLNIISPKNNRIKQLVTLLCGGKADLCKLFDRKEYGEIEEAKICFDDALYDEKEAGYQEALGDDYDFIERAKEVYDTVILSNILKGDNSGYISCAKVKTYEKHKKDLSILKEAIREHCTLSEEERKKLYHQTFGILQKGKANYSVYIGMTMKKGIKLSLDDNKCSSTEFYKFVQKEIFPNIEECEQKDYIEREIELETFMPKVRSKENSVIPYQLHEKELNKILENAQRYMPFLTQRDESGYSVSDKIKLLLTFKLPYYVGPLNEHSPYAWVIREKGRITPWNFEQKVNLDASAEQFISRMTSKCSYLVKEDVLPMSSLTYERFMVLNEINNLKICSEPISVELKQAIYHDLYERRVKVTVKKLLDYLRREKGYTDITREDITGIDVEIKSSLKSYHAFKRNFTGIELTEQQKEDIVKDMTLFGAEPALLKKRLFVKYPAFQSQITALLKDLKCKEWGRLSYKLLNGIAVEVPGKGMVGTVLYKMWITNQNFMQLIATADSEFGRLIQQENGVNASVSNKIHYDMVQDLYVSPAVKRQIWKALQVIDEITGAMGHAPKRIFVEMAREHSDNTRSVTRKDRLLDLYRNIKEEQTLYTQLKGEGNDRLRNDKLYLYYTQMGHCAYTNREIDLDELFDNNLYDIDHIYPRSKTADDSIDNRVLVYKPVNIGKQDIYPIDPDIRTKMWDKWYVWYQKGLISEEKYKRLIRTTELTSEELESFVNRQLVETRQSTKAFMDLLKQIMPDVTELVYSKAGNVARFRQQYKITKVRELNDLHHAKDAYLNIVVGNVYHLKFTKNVRQYFAKNGTYRTYNLIRMFDYDVSLGSETAWNAGDNGTISRVKKVLQSDKVLVTRQIFERRGQLYKVQPVKKGKGQVPLKGQDGSCRLSDISKYGGYDSATITYFALVRGLDKKERQQRYVVPIPLYLAKRIETDVEYAIHYYAEFTGLHSVTVLKPKILLQTLMVCDGFLMRLASRSDKYIVLNNANQLSLPETEQKVLKDIYKYKKDSLEKKDAKVSDKSAVNDATALQLYDIFLQKLKESIYAKMLGRFVTPMEAGREKFIALPLEEKTQHLSEIMKLFQCTPEMPDMSRTGGSSKSGRLKISMNVTDRTTLAIIHQSVTGLYEQLEKVNV